MLGATIVPAEYTGGFDANRGELGIYEIGTTVLVTVGWIAMN